MRANWAKFHSENSWLRRYAPIILSAVISAAIAAATLFTEIRANQRAEEAEADRYRNEQASTALRLFFENPSVFDGDVGAENLQLLRTTTPQETVDKIESVVQLRAARVRAQAAAQAYGAALASGGAASRPAPQAIRAAEQKRYQTLASSPSLESTRVDSPPTDFTVYLQYGARSAMAARNLGSALTRAGYKVPSIEPQSVAPDATEVRYFLPTQRQAAQQLASAVGMQLGATPAIRFVGEGLNLPDGILEVWLPAAALVDETASDAPRTTASGTQETTAALLALNTWNRTVLINRTQPRAGAHALVALTQNGGNAARNEAFCSQLLAKFPLASFEKNAVARPPRPIYWPHIPTETAGRADDCSQLLARFDYARARVVMDKAGLRGAGPYLIVSDADGRNRAALDFSSLNAQQTTQLLAYFAEGFDDERQVWAPPNAPPVENARLTSAFGSSIGAALRGLTAPSSKQTECLGDRKDATPCR